MPKTKWTHKKRARVIQPNGRDVFKGECILDEKSGEDGQALYLLKYEGYGLEEAEWVPDSYIGDGLLADWEEEKQLLDDATEDGDSSVGGGKKEIVADADATREPASPVPSTEDTESLLEIDFSKVDCIIADDHDDETYLLLMLPDPATGKRGKPVWIAGDNVPDLFVEIWKTEKATRIELLPEGVQVGVDGAWSEIGKLFFAAVWADDSDDSEVVIVWPKEKGSLWISPEHWATIIQPGGLRYMDFSQGEPSREDFIIVFPDGDDEGTTVAQVKRREAAREQSHITDDRGAGELMEESSDEQDSRGHGRHDERWSE